MKHMTRNTIPARTPPGLTRSALPLMAQGGSIKLAMGQERGVKGCVVSLRIFFRIMDKMSYGIMLLPYTNRIWIVSSKEQNLLQNMCT